MKNTAESRETLGRSWDSFGIPRNPGVSGRFIKPVEASRMHLEADQKPLEVPQRPPVASHKPLEALQRPLE
eukprot:7265268-Pyramimonas_sp.AAC.1